MSNQTGATPSVNTPLLYDTEQQKEIKNIGRPRSNSQDNSSATSALDIVRGTVVTISIPQPESNNSSGNTVSHKESAEQNNPSSSDVAVINSSKPIQDSSKDISNESEVVEHNLSARSGKSSPSLDGGGSQSPKGQPQSNWTSADVLYQKIRENLKTTTSHITEIENKKEDKPQIDFRQVLKKKQ